MAAPTPTTEPTTINAGDTAKWSRLCPDYLPTDGWVLTYTLSNAAQRYTATATADPADPTRHLLLVPATTTATWAAGSYAWRAQVANAGEVYTVATGTLQVLPSFATATDARSHARKALEAIEAHLENPQSMAASSYEIAGRKLSRYPLPDLLALRDRYRAEVARENAAQALAAGRLPPGRVFVRFGA